MPTSSQANILRGSDEGRNTSITYQFVRSPRRSAVNKDNRTKSPEKDMQTCELVKFDFHVSSQQPAVDGFEGVFAYDNKTNSCRWQICSIAPKHRYSSSAQSPREKSNKEDSFKNEENMATSEESDTESTVSSILPEQLSEIKAHFTTPCSSLLDNTKYPINPRTELHGLAASLRKPKCQNNIDSFDTATYRQLEGLGFRHRTTYSPSGALVRIHDKSQMKSPTKPFCAVSPLLQESPPKLTINNLDPMTVPPRSVIPYKRQGFTSKMFLDKKERTKALKKSLLDEVKQCVNWEQRVTPAMNLRRGSVKASPNAICFSLRKLFDFAHSDVKELIEFQFKTKVKAIQYDPLSVRMSDPETFDRWIVTLTSRDDCDKVIKQGMIMDGDKVIIRCWDDVMNQESAFFDNIGFDYPCRYRLQKELHNQVLKNFLTTPVH